MDIFPIVQSLFPDIEKDSNYYKNPCVTLYIDLSNMIVSKISKCDLMTGNQTVERIIELGTRLYNLGLISQINLTDTSSIYLNTENECSINMSIYFILAIGESWYNRHGFKSKSYAKELAHNSKIRSWTLTEYVKQGVINRQKKRYGPDLTEENLAKAEEIATKYTNEFFLQFANLHLNPSASIGFIFEHLKNNNVLPNCNNPQTRLIINLINTQFDLLKYNSELVYKFV